MPIVERLTETPDVAPFPGLSHAVTATGTMIFVAGQVPLDRDGSLIGPDDLAAQTRQCLRNLVSVLAASGAGLADVVRMNWYLLDASQVALVREIREEFLRPALGDTPNPASTLIQVAALFRPDILVEVDAIAALP